MMNYTVYGLSETEGGPLRYIGVTGTPIETRLTKHVAKAKRAVKPSALDAWLLACGRPCARILSSVLGLANAQAEEKRAIATTRASGADLLNRWAGGQLQEGVTRTAETRDRIAANSRGMWETSRAKIVEAQKAGKARPDAKERVGAAMKEVWERPGMVRHQSLAHATVLTEENVRTIKRMIAAGDRNADIADRFHITPHHVSSIRIGRIWRHVTNQGGVAAEVGYL